MEHVAEAELIDTTPEKDHHTLTKHRLLIPRKQTALLLSQHKYDFYEAYKTEKDRTDKENFAGEQSITRSTLNDHILISNITGHTL